RSAPADRYSLTSHDVIISGIGRRATSQTRTFRWRARYLLPEERQARTAAFAGRQRPFGPTGVVFSRYGSARTARGGGHGPVRDLIPRRLGRKQGTFSRSRFRLSPGSIAAHSLPTAVAMLAGRQCEELGAGEV